MKKHLSNKTILPVLITILAFLVFWFNLTSTKYDLKGIKIDSVKIAGESYSVKDNKIFESGREIKSSLNPIDTYKYIKAAKLAIFYQNTKEDPLFTGPGLNEESLASSVDKLEKKQANLISTFNLKDNFLPTNFLRDIIEIKKIENKFLADPGEIEAKNLISSYEKANNSYKKNASDLKKILESLPKDGREIAQLGSVTTQEIIYKDLEKIIENADRLEQKIKSRGNSLIFFGSTERFRFKTYEEENLNGESKIGNPIPKEDLYLMKDNLNIRGPYEILSNCFSGNGEFRREIFYQTEDKTNTLSFPKLASTNYYVELPKESADTLTRAYKRHGLSYRAQGETNSYTCNNLEYQINVALVDYFHQAYKNDQMSPKLKGYLSDEKINGISLKEREFFDAKYPSQEKLESLSEKYLESYLQTADESLRGELLKRHLLIKTKYSNFNSTINVFSYLLEMVTKIKEFNTGQGISSDGETNAPYIYYTRNGYSLLYLSFSSSVWQVPEKLRFVKEGITSKNSYIKHDSLIQKIGAENVSEINNVKREKIIEDLSKILSD